MRDDKYTIPQDEMKLPASMQITECNAYNLLFYDKIKDLIMTGECEISTTEVDEVASELVDCPDPRDLLENWKFYEYIDPEPHILDARIVMIGSEEYVKYVKYMESKNAK